MRLFNLSLVENSCLRRNQREPQHRYVRLTRTTCNLSMQSCVELRHISNKGMAVVGNGNIDVGSENLTRKPGQPAVEVLGDGSAKPRIEGRNPLRTERPRISGATISGAMAQQCGDLGRGNQSAPQKFVRLVGCRDPKARPGQR